MHKRFETESTSRSAKDSYKMSINLVFNLLLIQSLKTK